MSSRNGCHHSDLACSTLVELHAFAHREGNWETVTFSVPLASTPTRSFDESNKTSPNRTRVTLAATFAPWHRRQIRTNSPFLSHGPEALPEAGCRWHRYRRF